MNESNFFLGKRDKQFIVCLLLSAAEEIRTPMPVTALPPQGSASTSFATAASLRNAKVIQKSKKTTEKIPAILPAQDDTESSAFPLVGLLHKYRPMMIFFYNSFSQ